jgi:hypothetical protein
MVLVVVAVVLLLIVGLGVTDLGLRSRLFSIRTAANIAARCAADAGLEKAMYEMNQKLETMTWSDSNLPSATDEVLGDSDATYSYTVTADVNSRYIVQAIGSSGPAQRTVNSTFKLRGLFEYAMFTKGSILLRNGTTVDAYNLDAGESPLKIGTNSTAAGSITAKTGVTVDGDVAVGVGGDTGVVVDNMLEASITGDVYPQLEENDMPSITVPASLAGLVSSGIITSSTTISANAKYDSINLVGASDIVMVDAAVAIYVVGDVRLGSGDELRIVDANVNPNASLTVYVGGTVISDNGSTINNLTMDSSKLKIFGLDTCTDFQLKQGGAFYGAIYAPNASIQLYNGTEVYGSMIGDSFIQDQAGSFHYDASLREASANDEGVKFVVERWSEQ